ncbi:MAG: cobalamin-dependent protein, partial [Trueperaceae bacterium]
TGADRDGRPGAKLRADLTEALIDLDETRCDRILSEAHALHPLDAVLSDIVTPSLVEIGQRWHDGLITTVNEHFATSYLQGRLMALLSLAGGAHPDSPAVLVTCAPHDRHEIGALMLAVMLRRHGYRVTYLGADTPVADLAALAFDRKPAAILVSASGAESLAALEARRDHLLEAAPIVAFGGRAFDAAPETAERLGGHYLADNVVDAVARFDALIRSKRTGRS